MTISLSQTSIFYNGLDHPECVAIHPDGSVWAGGEAGQIYRISKDAKRMDLVANTGGFILGIAFSPQAKWLAVCDLKHRCLWRLDPKTGHIQRFADSVGRRRFNIPNYAAFAEDGTLYLTDSGAFRKINGCIYQFDADHSGRGRLWHKGPFNFANGLAISPDERSLVLACTWRSAVERVAIEHDGKAGKRELYAKLPARTLPDGVAFDAKGNLYVSCYTPSRIYKVSAAPTRARRRVTLLIDDWESHTLGNPTNMAFGGPDHTDLYVANLGLRHITKIKMRTRGRILPSHQSLEH